jgi:hypothetical protein
MITGPLLRKISKTCQDAGADLVLAHHTIKGIIPGADIALKDLAMAGFAEFFRQWILLNHNTPFDLGAGRTDLRMNVGGSAGHHSSWGVMIDEGKVDLDLKNRQWRISVSPFGLPNDDAPETAQTDQRDVKLKTKDKDLIAKFLMGLDEVIKLDQPATKSAIRTASGLGTSGQDRAIFLLLKDNIIENCTVMVRNGKGKSRPVEGFRRKGSDPDDPDKRDFPGQSRSRSSDPDDLAPLKGASPGHPGQDLLSFSEKSESENLAGTEPPAEVLE